MCVRAYALRSGAGEWGFLRPGGECRGICACVHACALHSGADLRGGGGGVCRGLRAPFYYIFTTY